MSLILEQTLPEFYLVYLRLHPDQLRPPRYSLDLSQIFEGVGRWRGDKRLTKLLQHDAQTSHQRLKYKVYPDGRHEMLNETNRDEVMRDWLDWVTSVT